MDIYEFLFSEPLGVDGGPLFRSQSELAEAIKTIPSGGFDNPDRSVDSIRNFINQVLNRRRPPSPNLRKSIAAAVKARLGKGISEDDAINTLHNSFMVLQDPSLAPELPLDDTEEFDALEAAANKATVQYIFTYQPAESTESMKAVRLRNTLAEKLGFTTDSNTSSSVQYVFHVHRDAEAIHFWRKLEEYLTQIKVTNVHERLLSADTDTHPRLSVWVTDAFLCAIPYVVFDPDSPQAAGFVFFYHPQNRVSVARMSSDALAQWTQEIYRPLTSNVELRDNLRLKRKRIRFCDACTNPL